MCFEEKTVTTKEGFVSLAIEKRVRNKRRRDPDMYMDVLLSSTVKRLKYEIVNESYGRHKEKRENSPSPTEKDIDSPMNSNQKSCTEPNEVAIAIECLQSTLETLDDEIRDESTSCTLTTTTNAMSFASTGFSPTNTEENVKMNSDNLCAKIVDSPESISESTSSGNDSLKESLKDDDVDFDTLMQSLLEICEPLSGNVDELIKEYSIDPLSSGSFDLLSSNDPFLPGMFEVMCS